MATITDYTYPPVSELGPPPDSLNNGDRLTQKEFHSLYEKAGENAHAELIDGIVYMASPLRARHGSHHAWLTMLIALYSGRTPGTQVCDNTTVVLSESYEPQPDLLLRVRREYGGKSGIDDRGYVEGAPELVIEVADSSRGIDLNVKRAGYARHGVEEYWVLNLIDDRIQAFDLTTGIETVLDAQSICRSKVFPGLWINVPAIFADNLDGMLSVLNDGLATPEHAAFVAKLASQKCS